MIKKYSCLAFNILFFFFNCLYAQEQSPAVEEETALQEADADQKVTLIQSEGRIVQLSQNQTASLLAVTFTDRVEVYSTDNFNKEFVINQDKVVKTAFYNENGNDYIALMTDYGSFKSRRIFFDGESWTCDYNEPYYAAECADSSRASSVTAVAFSRNSDYVAAAFSDGSIQVHFRLRVTQKLISRLIKQHSTGVYGLEFSPTGEYLASVSMDGNAYIWNCYSNTKVTQIKDIYARARVPVCFTEDSVYIVSLDGRNSFRISDFSGNTLFSILTGRPITAIKPLKNPDLIAVRNDKNEVMVYSISSRRPVSVSTVNEEELFTTFDFDFAAEVMYAGFADGRVNIVEALPYLDDNSLLVTDSTLAGGGGGIGGGNGLYQKFSSLSFCAGANYLMKPYLYSINFRGEYCYSKAISPFLLGAGCILSMGFPRKDFPASYKIYDQYVDAPKLLSAVFYVPVGYAISPWNNDIRILTDLKAGLKVSSLGLFTTAGSIVGDPAVTFFFSGGAGMQIKGFEFDINCEYDGIGKVSPSVFLGYAVRIGDKK